MGTSAGQDFLERPRALRVVLAIHQRSALTMQEFEDATEYVWHSAKKLRDALEAWGLVTVEPAETEGRPGNPGQRIKLTPAGRKVAEAARNVGRVADRDRAVRTLLALSQQGSMTSREFAMASKYVPENAKKLREELEAWGIVRVETAKTNRAPAHRISLTPAGVRSVEAFAEIVRIVDRAAK